jgi:hypothetical protein
LRACHFMNEVQVDVQKIGFVDSRVHDVVVPDFLGEGGGVAHDFLNDLECVVSVSFFSVCGIVFLLYGQHIGRWSC